MVTSAGCVAWIESGRVTLTLRPRIVRSDSIPETTISASSMEQRRYARLLPVFTAATPRPTAANTHHQPSRVGRIAFVRRHHQLARVRASRIIEPAGRPCPPDQRGTGTSWTIVRMAASAAAPPPSETGPERRTRWASAGIAKRFTSSGTR